MKFIGKDEPLEKVVRVFVETSECGASIICESGNAQQVIATISEEGVNMVALGGIRAATELGIATQQTPRGVYIKVNMI